MAAYELHMEESIILLYTSVWVFKICESEPLELGSTSIDVSEA